MEANGHYFFNVPREREKIRKISTLPNWNNKKRLPMNSIILLFENSIVFHFAQVQTLKKKFGGHLDFHQKL